jgi:hypothetical protein
MLSAYSKFVEATNPIAWSYEWNRRGQKSCCLSHIVTFSGDSPIVATVPYPTEIRHHFTGNRVEGSSAHASEG